MLRDRIISTTIALFNQYGASKVTMKQIADHLRISPGNLTYHFKTKEILMLELYQLMHDEAVGFTIPDGYLTLDHFEAMMMNYVKFNRKYCFFFNDIVFITKQYPKVGKMYEASNLRRFKEAKKLIGYYVDTDRMMPEPRHFDYDKLIHSIWMITAFWSAQRQVIDHPSYNVNQQSPMLFLWQQLFPFLTTKGWNEYLEIQKHKAIINK